jgi:hypothetical protein
MVALAALNRAWIGLYFQCSEVEGMKWHEFCGIPEMGVTLRHGRRPGDSALIYFFVSAFQYIGMDGL